jgi:hypothetical protein
MTATYMQGLFHSLFLQHLKGVHVDRLVIKSKFHILEQNLPRRKATKYRKHTS